MQERARAPGCDTVAAAEDWFRCLADDAPVLIWRTDATMACTFFNQPWLDFTGRRLDQELGTGWAEGVHPEDRADCLRGFAEAFEARQPHSMTYRLRRHDGAWRWLLDKGRPFSLAGAFAGYLGSCVDVTEMREALEEARRARAEHDALLAELHHRVKNNTQATTSFLALQANRAADPTVATSLRGAAVRVLLASNVQDRLFRLHDDARVELGVELVTTARAALEAVGRPGLRLEERIEAGIEVLALRAAPLALMVNELVVNAARHAYPDGAAGLVRIGLRRLPGGRGEMRVEDEGVGLPEAIRGRLPRHCLGLHLSQRLARQARAQLRLDGPPGTIAVVEFHPGEAKATA